MRETVLLSSDLHNPGVGHMYVLAYINTDHFTAKFKILSCKWESENNPESSLFFLFTTQNKRDYRDLDWNCRSPVLAIDRYA